MEKTSTGLDENVAGLLCYVLGWISGLVFILIEQESKFVQGTYVGYERNIILKECNLV